LSLFAINAIYKASEGEGVHIGTPQVFVRFQGCNIGCVNCDSIDTWDFSAGERLTLDQVLAQVIEQGGDKFKRVSITGGDPLHPKILPQVLQLVSVLKKKNYWINVEAAGTRVVSELFDAIDFISFDYKTPCTKVKTNLSLVAKLATQFPNKFQIKSVIESRVDYDDVVQAKTELLLMLQNANVDSDFPWVLTPAFNLGELMPFERVLDLIAWNENDAHGFRVITQQHKILHGSEKKKV